MIDNVLSVFASGYVALMAVVLVIFFELKYQVLIDERRLNVLRGVALVLFGVVSILLHLHVHEGGVFIDLRGVGVALATLFGGILVGALTTLAEILVRFVLGGGGSVAGTLGLLLDFALVVGLLHLFRRDVARHRMRRILLAGAAVGLGESLSLLLIPPFAVGWEIFRQLAPSLGLTQLLGTLLFGWLWKMQDDRVRARDEARMRIRNLNETMKRGLAALSTAMVHHDPSTAGHEQRVADLCVRVAQAMGMDEERIEGLQLAAMVHDIGQIRVPGEILSRPRRLSPEEFELVKLHVEAGYRILKDVPFPWPIATIVRQHHEHMDGSGYPHALRGEQMLLEARILHVCDALEAMLSHRPFRRARSIEQALTELQAHRASWYDPTVVDVVVKLFREAGYVFPTVKLEVEE